MKLTVCSKKLERTNNVKYLVLQIAENLTEKFIYMILFLKWIEPMQYDLKQKYFVNFEILISVHVAILQSHIFNVYTAWGLSRYPQHKISVL